QGRTHGERDAGAAEGPADGRVGAGLGEPATGGGRRAAVSVSVGDRLGAAVGTVTLDSYRTRSAVPSSAVVDREKREGGVSLPNFIRSLRSKTSFVSTSTSAGLKEYTSSDPSAATGCQPAGALGIGGEDLRLESLASQPKVSSIHRTSASE
ncbi:hypothetical protein, partial [Streptomyces sp. NPDC056491]|uniref:hypothetical protein n=1 Tax=Streptomyces sp. NPDC056491 TaxID=3345837 RepID=UPI0036851ECB